MKNLIRVRQAAERLGVALATVYAMCEQRQIVCVRVGSGRGTIRIPEEAITAYLSQAITIPDAPSQALIASGLLNKTTASADGTKDGFTPATVPSAKSARRRHGP